MREPGLDAAARAAVAWMVRLQSGTVAAAEQQAFERWLRADPEHARAWAALEARVREPVRALREIDVRRPGQLREASALLRNPGRRPAIKLLALASVLGSGVLVADRYTPVRTLFADLRTATAERRRYVMADGSEITLNARSAADFRFGDGMRCIRLQTGDLVASVQPDPARPFVVSTAHGSVRALGTRFLVSSRAGASRVAVLEHSVELRDSRGRGLSLQAGQAARFDADSLRMERPGQPSGAEWMQGYLVAEAMPLGEVVDALQRYRAGLLRVAPGAARLPVQGSFPLDDTDRALRALEETLPLRVRRLGTLLVSIEAR